MKYEAPKPISKQAVLEALGGCDEVASEALVRAAITIDDRIWVESTLLRALSDQRLEVRRAAILGFGHLARTHRQLTLEMILPLLKQYVEDTDLGGTVEDALEDIAMFVSPQSDFTS